MAYGQYPAKTGVFCVFCVFFAFLTILVLPGAKTDFRLPPLLVVKNTPFLQKCVFLQGIAQMALYGLPPSSRGLPRRTTARNRPKPRFARPLGRFRPERALRPPSIFGKIAQMLAKARFCTISPKMASAAACIFDQIVQMLAKARFCTISSKITSAAATIFGKIAQMLASARFCTILPKITKIGKMLAKLAFTDFGAKPSKCS